MNTLDWTYHNPVRVIYKAGSIDKISQYISQQRILLVTTPGFRRRGVVDKITACLGQRLIGVIDVIAPNPDILEIDSLGEKYRQSEPDLLLALGGGSSIDAAKCLAKILAQPPGRTFSAHFREGLVFEEKSALAIATIPTTSGTGSEVTPFATIWDFEMGQKYSMMGPDIYPEVSILDPELTFKLPEEITISSGLDSISHALESGWNKNANSITLSLVAKSLQLSLSALRVLKQDAENREARGAMMQASLLSGLAISQTRTALAHSISYALTVHFGMPHGFACSFTLPALLRFNAEADDGRLEDLAHSLGYRDIQMFSNSLCSLLKGLELPSYFSRYIADNNKILEFVDEMIMPSRADNNLREADIDDVVMILKSSLRDIATET